MANLLDLRTRIKNALAIQGTEFDTDIDDSICSALTELEQEPMWFLQKKDTVTLSTGNDSVSLPSDFAAPFNARVLINNVYRDKQSGFQKQDFTVLEDLYRKQLTSGYPMNYAYWAGSIYVDVTANADYIIDLTYLQKDAVKPSDDTDTSVWFNEGLDAVRTLAMAMFKDDVEQYDSVGNDWAKAERALNKLRERNTYYSLKGGL